MGTQKMRELSLFSGGGGGILASHLLGWELKGCAEWDEGARSILEARVADGSIPDVTLHKDVQDLDPTEYIGEVDIVTGGFPCQPFSNAGKKLGVDDPRNMWPHTVRILKGTEAPYGYFENVASLLGSGYFGTVLKDLVEAGYHVSWDCVPASAVGAPHIRDRLWIFAQKMKEDDPTVVPGSLPLLTVATLEDGNWKRTTGNATWSETDDLGEPAKWPRAGVVIGNVAHATMRSGFPKGIRKYGVWPMCRLPWVQSEEPSESTAWKKWPTPSVMDGSRVEHIRTKEQIEEARKTGGCRNLREEVAHSEVWATPTTMDTLPPKSQEVLDREAFGVRAGRSKPNNLRDQINMEAGHVDWKGKETFPTPTATERSGVNPNTGRGGGLSHEIKQREMYPTPLAGENRKSAQSLKRIEEGGQSTPPGLAQHAELKEGIIPREYEGVPYEELPPKVQAMWPTPTVTNAVSNHGYQKSGDNYYPTLSGAAGAAPGPNGGMWPTPTQGMHKQDVNDSGEYAQRVRDSGFQEMLPVAVKLRDDEGGMWPTPRAANPGSRPNGKGGKVLSEEVQIAEGVRERGEYVEGRTFPTPTAEDAGRAGSAEAWDEYKEEGKTTGARLRNYAQKWPTPSAMDGARRGKAIDPDHWLEARDKHAERGVNKHLSLDVAVAFEDQGRSPKEKRDVTEEIGKELSNTPVEEMFEGDAPSEKWPTPVASEWKGPCLREGSTSLAGTGLTAKAFRKEGATSQKENGLLNPEWVAWLMGWPMGWTSPDPLPEGALEDWVAQSHHRVWWREEPEGIPRLTKKSETQNRTVRLKALGNGQVSLCCARSFEVLQRTLNEVMKKVSEGEAEVSLDDFFGF